MIALIRAEFAKLGGSLAMLFALIVPALTAGLALLTIVVNDNASNWGSIIDRFTLPLWAMFIFPMASATFATLAAQVEYRSRAWDHVLALPFARWKIFAAKALVILLALVIMTALLLVYTYGLVWLAGMAIGQMPSGDPQFAEVAIRSVRFLAAGLFLSMLQLWAALRFANFVIPLAVGIGGTLVGLAVLITGTDDAEWFPWVLTLRTLLGESWQQPVMVGLAGGMAVLAIMLVDLSNRWFR